MTTPDDRAAREAAQLMGLLADRYADRPDDETISIGHWRPDRSPPNGIGRGVIKEFIADIQVTVGHIKKMTAVYLAGAADAAELRWAVAELRVVLIDLTEWTHRHVRYIDVEPLLDAARSAIARLDSPATTTEGAQGK